MSDLIKLSGSQNKQTNKQQQLKVMKAEWEAAEEKGNQWEKGTKEDHRGRWGPKYIIYYKNVTLKLFIAYNYICF